MLILMDNKVVKVSRFVERGYEENPGDVALAGKTYKILVPSLVRGVAVRNLHHTQWLELNEIAREKGVSALLRNHEVIMWGKRNGVMGLCTTNLHYHCPIDFDTFKKLLLEYE